MATADGKGGGGGSADTGGLAHLPNRKTLMSRSRFTCLTSWGTVARERESGQSVDLTHMSHNVRTVCANRKHS